MTELQQIKQKTGCTNNECSCATCQQMCERSPCLGTPQDILRLINNGYGQELAQTTWISGLPHGIPPVQMTQILFKKIVPLGNSNATGEGCLMYHNGLCKLHTAQLKPMEGYLSTCDKDKILKLLDKGFEFLPFAIARLWLQPENKKTVQLINYYINLRDDTEENLAEPRL